MANNGDGNGKYGDRSVNNHDWKSNYSDLSVHNDEGMGYNSDGKGA